MDGEPAGGSGVSGAADLWEWFQPRSIAHRECGNKVRMSYAGSESVNSEREEAVVMQCEQVTPAARS